MSDDLLVRGVSLSDQDVSLDLVSLDLVSLDLVSLEDEELLVKQKPNKNLENQKIRFLKQVTRQ